MRTGVSGIESRPDWLLGFTTGGAMLISAILGVLWKVLDVLQQHEAAVGVATVLVPWAVAAPGIVGVASVRRALALAKEVKRLKQADNA